MRATFTRILRASTGVLTHSLLIAVAAFSSATTRCGGEDAATTKSDLKQVTFDKFRAISRNQLPFIGRGARGVVREPEQLQIKPLLQ